MRQLEPLGRRLDLDGDPDVLDLLFQTSQLGPKDCPPSWTSLKRLETGGSPTCATKSTGSPPFHDTTIKQTCVACPKQDVAPSPPAPDTQQMGVSDLF